MSRKISILLTGAMLVAISIGFSDSAFASSGGGGLPGNRRCNRSSNRSQALSPASSHWPLSPLLVPC